MTRTDNVVVAGTPATTTPAPGRVNAAADGDEPLGEAPELTMPRVASLLDRQAQALKEIRHHLASVDVKQFIAGGGFAAAQLPGQKSCAAVLMEILERHGLA